MSKEFGIRIDGVQVQLPTGRALFSIAQFEIPHGSHVLIQGESGKGKTTLLHLVAGLFAPDRGSVHIGDAHLSAMDDAARCEWRRAHIGVIFQKLNLLDHLTVEENIFLSSPPDAKKARASADRLNLKDRYHDRCGVLSLGEQQRVAVARVLAQKPDVFLADEPTSSLDDKNASAVMESLKNAARDKTFVVVSHDHRIARFFDRVVRFEEIAK